MTNTSVIIRYTVADSDGNQVFEDFEWEQELKAQAEAFAEQNGLVLMANVYNYTDSHVSKDYTREGS